MIRHETYVDNVQDGKAPRHLVLCPECRQKLFDAVHLNGTAIIRVKCRRCGRYVNAEVIGIDKD